MSGWIQTGFHWWTIWDTIQTQGILILGSFFFFFFFWSYFFLPGYQEPSLKVCHVARLCPKAPLSPEVLLTDAWVGLAAWFVCVPLRCWWWWEVVSSVCLSLLVARPGTPAGDPLPANGKQSQNVPEALTPAREAHSSHHTSEQINDSQLSLECRGVERRGRTTPVVTDSSSVRSWRVRVQALAWSVCWVRVGKLNWTSPHLCSLPHPSSSWPWTHSQEC